MRGMQSAGILVVRPIPPSSESTNERIVDIRVDDATNPFVELRRLLNITLGVPAKLTQHANDLARDGKLADAIAELRKALAVTPNNEQIHYTLAQRYAQAGDAEHAIQSLGEAVRRQPRLKKQAAEESAFTKLKDRPEFRRLIEP